jgi:alpha-L-fucosidase
LLNEADVKSLIAFKELREKEFSHDIAKGKPVAATNTRGRNYSASNVNDGNAETYWATIDHQNAGDLIIDLGQETEVNRIAIQEYIKLGQRVQEFKVAGFENGKWKPIIEGTTIGYKIIRKFPVEIVTRIKITISKSKASPLISNIELYRAPGI